MMTATERRNALNTLDEMRWALPIDYLGLDVKLLRAMESIEAEPYMEDGVIYKGRLPNDEETSTDVTESKLMLQMYYAWKKIG